MFSKGSNIAIAQKKSKEEIIKILETTCRRLPAEAAEEIKPDAARILRTTTRPKPNLSKKELKAVVVMNTATYLSKVEKLLQNQVCKPIKKTR